MTPIQRALRTHGEEIINRLPGEHPAAQAILADLERWNALSRWARRHLGHIERHWVALGCPEPFRVLDVGTGRGALLLAIREHFAAKGVRVELAGVDLDPGYLGSARERLGTDVELHGADARELPFTDGAFHVGTNALMMHHLPQDARPQVVGEMGRVCGSVYLFDLELTLYGAAGFAVAATLLGFRPETRHDGVLSVRRGSTLGEFRELTRGLPGRARRVFPSALAVLP